ncbi:MAG: glutathione S-transferase family protein [Gammaproteobacteria bacterium]|nr:glutathione S-transferase family protein [Gammaproteobacteria bacterium]
MSQKIEIYGDSISGNCYKLQLACAQLALDYIWHEVDILAGESRTEEFLAMNPNGRVPLVALPDGRFLSESNAILSYLADGNEFAGRDRYEAANILRWMFFEQYSHEPYIATSRFIIRYLGRPADREGDLEARQDGGYMALDVMEKELTEHDFIANDAYSIADIALYAYTRVADEGGFDLGGYPQIRAWLQRVEKQDRFVPMSDRH